MEDRISQLETVMKFNIFSIFNFTENKVSYFSFLMS